MAQLNSIASDPPLCTRDDPDGSDAPYGESDEPVGHLQWRLTAVDQETWQRIYSKDDTTIWYRLECYIEELHGGDFGILLDVQEFTAITPELIAAVAIDDALESIPTQEIHTSPAPEALVGFDTWFWVEGVPQDGVTATASVPGIEVTATATPGGVHYELGDGNRLECEGTGVAWSPGATSDCTHSYEVAGHYTVTSTILWTGTYTVNGAGPFDIGTAVPRTDTFELPVAEAQAINTGAGG